MPWTQRQADAIESRNETLLVSAAAGSGKTAVLVERVITLILQDHIGLDQMLIVTFTNAAASEMKEKIHVRIKKALAEDVLSAADRRFLRHQLSIMGSARISTFHRFASEIIHRYYHIIDVAPQLAVADPARQELLKAEAMDELFEAMFEEENADFKLLMDCYAGVKTDQPVRELILSFCSFLDSLPDPGSFARRLQQGELTDTSLFYALAESDLQTRLTAALHAMDACEPFFLHGAEGMGLPPTELLAEKHRIDREYLQAALNGLSQRPLEETIGLLQKYTFQRMQASKAEKDSWEQIKAEVSALRDMAKEVIKKLRKEYAGFSQQLLELEKEVQLPLFAALCRLTADFDDRYRQKKLAKGLMDFSDMEHYALAILENQQVCSEYREAFRYVFIYEYQDSNMVQETLIRRVSRPDNLFMVGDVKQSIYKFRLAEPELFLTKYQEMKAEKREGRVIDLNANFRSKASVIALVNRLFQVIMNRQTCAMDYDEDAALLEGMPYTGPLSYEPQLYLIDSTRQTEPGKETAEDALPADEESFKEEPDGEEASSAIEELKAAELEALQAAGIIRSYLGRPIYDSKKQSERPLSYRDMVILMPVVKGKGEIFYKALAAAGIPVYLERTEGYFDTLEVQVFLNLLRLINNSRNDLALISVLHFPAFGFSADQLAAIRLFAMQEGLRAREPFSRAFLLYGEKGSDEALRQRCRQFTERIAAWKKEAAYRTLGDFVWMLLCESGILDCCLALPGGIQRQANLRALADKAESYEAESALGLYGFITYIESIKDKVSLGEAEIFSEEADAVRIMTIHKSKGLEFPFVLVTGLAAQFADHGTPPDLVCHKQLGAGMLLVNPKTSLKNRPFIYRLIRRQQKKEELAERIRLLYVAATRAKDILIFSACKHKAAAYWNGLSVADERGTFADSYLALLYSAFAGQKTFHLIDRSRLAQAVSQQAAEDPFKEALQKGFCIDENAMPISQEELRQRLAFEIPCGDAENAKTKYSVSQLAELSLLDGNDTAAVPDFKDSFRAPSFIDPKERLDSAARGTAYHTVMEHLPFTSEGKSPGEIRVFMEQLCASGILTEPQLHAVDPGKIAAFFTSPIGRRVCASSRVLKEAPFTLQKEFRGRRILVQGTLDCCFIEDGCWILVDYKSNYVDPAREKEAMEHLQRTYRPQLAEYRYALQTITGIPVKEAVLYLFGPEKELVIK